jgi:hypothetical protein
LAKTDAESAQPPGETTLPSLLETASATPNGTASDAGERRRPGRAETVDEQLIPLLRGQPADGLTAVAMSGAVETEDKPGLGPRALRGIAIGVLLAIPLWIGLGLLVAWVVRSH